MPLSGLDLSSGARAGLTAFLAGVARSVADKNVTINNLLPGSFDTARLRSGLARDAKRSGLAESVIEERGRGVTSPPSVSAVPPSSATPARFSAARMPATSPVKAGHRRRRISRNVLSDEQVERPRIRRCSWPPPRPFAADHGSAAVARTLRAPDRHGDGREPGVREFRARHRAVRVGRRSAAVRRGGGPLRRVSGTDMGRRAVGRRRCAGTRSSSGFGSHDDPGSSAVRRRRGWELRDSHRGDRRIAASGKALARGRHHQRGRIARTAACSHRSCNWSSEARVGAWACSGYRSLRC